MVLSPSNPKASYLAHKADIDKAILNVLETGTYILGSEVTAFENEFADYIGLKYGVGVGNGTDALYLALRACGVGPGDEVVTVSHTAVATIAAIELCGAIPVLVDIDEQTYTMSADDIDSIVSHRTKAIVPVHLYGFPADMDRILDISKRYNLRVIEDCSQSHGAMYKGQMTGTFGDVGIFSFYPTKNLGALGDAGMVVTNDPELADKTKRFRQYGWKDRNISEIPGINTRLDEIQAAVLRVKLQWLSDDNMKRRRIAALYTEMLSETELRLPFNPDHVHHVYHQYAVCTQNRNDLREFLKAAGILTLVHYPIPIHHQPAYAGRIKCVSSMLYTERVAKEILSLPIYPELTLDSIRRISAVIRNWKM